MNFVFKMLQLEQQLLFSEFQRKVFSIMSRLNLENIIDPNLRRQLKFLSMPGPAALPQDQLSRVRIVDNKIAQTFCLKFNELLLMKNTYNIIVLHRLCYCWTKDVLISRNSLYND